MTRPRAAAILAAVLAVLCAGRPGAGQPVDLRPRWEKGATHRFRMELSSQQNVKLPGADGEGDAHSVKQDIRFTLRVIEAPPEGDNLVELSFDSIKASMDSGPGKDTYDSSKKPIGGKTEDRSVLADAFAPLAGTKLTLTVDRDGNITSVKGGEGLMPSELTAGLTQARPMSMLLGPVMTTRKGGGTASLNESWENEDFIESPLVGRLRLTTRHTLRSATEREARVAIEGTIATDSEFSDAPLAIRNGVYRGSYAWGRAEGMLRRLETTQSYTVEGDLGGVGGEGTVSITSEVVLKVTRED